MEIQNVMLVVVGIIILGVIVYTEYIRVKPKEYTVFTNLPNVQSLKIYTDWGIEVLSIEQTTNGVLHTITLEIKFKDVITRLFLNYAKQGYFVSAEGDYVQVFSSQFIGDQFFIYRDNGKAVVEMVH